MNDMRPGAIVKISDGSGIDSGKLARVISRRDISIDGRGIPINIAGAYRPINWREEIPLRLMDNGEIISMFKNRVKVIKDNEEESSREYWNTWVKLND